MRDTSINGFSPGARFFRLSSAEQHCPRYMLQKPPRFPSSNVQHPTRRANYQRRSRSFGAPCSSPPSGHSWTHPFIRIQVLKYQSSHSSPFHFLDLVTSVAHVEEYTVTSPRFGCRAQQREGNLSNYRTPLGNDRSVATSLFNDLEFFSLRDV
jgi:hypothetical protein